jgi:hypothetical protein
MDRNVVVVNVARAQERLVAALENVHGLEAQDVPVTVEHLRAAQSLIAKTLKHMGRSAKTKVPNEL